MYAIRVSCFQFPMWRELPLFINGHLRWCLGDKVTFVKSGWKKLAKAL